MLAQAVGTDTTLLDWNGIHKLLINILVHLLISAKSNDVANDVARIQHELTFFVCNAREWSIEYSGYEHITSQLFVVCNA